MFSDVKFTSFSVALILTFLLTVPPTIDLQQPMIVIYYAGVQHVFMETEIVRNEALGVHAFQEGSLESVPDAIRDSAPTRVHILDSATFFGPLSIFMRRLQREFGIESDVSLEFESMALSVPVNMSFAESELSLAHIYAIAANLCEEGAENAAPILTASLVVAPTNFVRKYNELVNTFKSRRHLKISSGLTGRPMLKRTQSRSPDATQMVTDEATGTTGTRSRSDSSASSASSTWSQLAVCDTASLAVMSDSEAASETSGSRRSPFLTSSASGRIRRGLTSSTGILFSSPMGSPVLSRYGHHVHTHNPSSQATPGHGLNHHLVQHIGPLPFLSDLDAASSSAPPLRASTLASPSSTSTSPIRPQSSRNAFFPSNGNMFKSHDDSESRQQLNSPLNRSLSPTSRPAPLRHFASTGGLLAGLPALPPAPVFCNRAAAANALSPPPGAVNAPNRKRPRNLSEPCPPLDSSGDDVPEYPPKRKVDSLMPHNPSLP